MDQPTIVPERQAFYRQIDPHSLAPLWERPAGMRVRDPVSPAVPYHWSYDDIVRPFMLPGRRSDHRQGGRTPRSDFGKPGPQGTAADHRFTIRRPAIDPAG